MTTISFHSCRWRKFFAAALFCTCLGVSVSSNAKKGGDSDPTINGEVLVQLRSTDALSPLLGKYQLSLLDRFGSRPIYRLKMIGSASVDDTLDALALDPNVLVAEPNFVHSAPEARRIRSWAIGTPEAYTAQWAPHALQLSKAHRISTGTGVRVAVLDTGVALTHPLLAGMLLPGFDFVDFDYDPSEVGSTADISYGHGTHVAGLVTMVAPGAKILPLRVLDRQGQGNAWVLAEAMLYAVDPDGNPSTDDGAQVINMSLGSFGRTRLFDTISLLTTCSVPNPADTVDLSDPGYNGDKQRCSLSRGAVIVAAAGNDASKRARQYPAAESAYGKLAVGASKANRRLAGFSNYGSWVDLAAPGKGITSSVPGGGYGSWSGTSMAAPLVSGTAALLRSLKPALSAKKLARRIARTTSLLCESQLRQVDPVAALTNVVPRDVRCP